MKFNRYIVLTILATLVFGCQKDDSDSNVNSRLGVLVQEFISDNLATKGGVSEEQVVPADTLWLNDSIYVEAVVDDMVDVIDSKPDTRATPITSASQITNLSIVMFNTGSGSWSASSSQETTESRSPMTASVINGNYDIYPVYQWVEGETNYRTLIAMSPYHTTSGFSLSANGQTLGVTVPSNVLQQQDLCVSNIEKNKNIQNLVGSNNNLQKFEMKHMMTAVGFEAVGYDLVLTSVKLLGINSKSTLTLHNRTWSAPTTPIDITASINADQWLNTEHIQTYNPWRNITPANGYMMLLPQVLSDNMKIEFTFTGRNGQPGGTYTMQLNQIKALGSSSSDWTAGMRITYRLRLKTRPAVQSDNIIITDDAAGSVGLFDIITSDDDDLTFSWTASWLGMYRGVATIVPSPESSGYFTPFVTGVGNWANVKFFARSANISTVADRIATVTLSGKKSGQRTFTVTHKKLIPLFINPTSPGEVVSGSGKTYTVNVTSGPSASWTTSPSAEVTVSPSSGKGSGTVTITVGDNPSDTSTRDIKVDFISGGSVKATWSATQNKGYSAVSINKLRWATGNLVKDGANGCKIGKPTDAGLYFLFGSIIGWGPTAQWDGTGKAYNVSLSSIASVVKPVELIGEAEWKSYSKYGDVPVSYNASAGSGDPCLYYLGPKWRLPTKQEMVDLYGYNTFLSENDYYRWSHSVEAIDGVYRDGCVWAGPGAASGDTKNSVFFPPTGVISQDYDDYEVADAKNGLYGSSTGVPNYELSYRMCFERMLIYMGAISKVESAHAIRCVRPL